AVRLAERQLLRRLDVGGACREVAGQREARIDPQRVAGDRLGARARRLAAGQHGGGEHESDRWEDTDAHGSAPFYGGSGQESRGRNEATVRTVAVAITIASVSMKESN